MTAPNSSWLIEEFCAFQRTLALRTAIEMDLFTRIGAGANTIRALAAEAGASERGLRILCDYLTVQGHLFKRGARYSLTLNTRLYLTTASPAYLGSAVKFLASDSAVAAFCQLRPAVERGGPESLDLDWTQYARWMAPLAEPVASFAAATLIVDTTKPIQVLDIAAGHGLYGLAIAERHRAAHIFALDLPQVLEIAVANARRAGVAERYHPISGDALEADFDGPYDLVLVANFAHHLDQAANVRLFKKIRAALKRGGRMALIDFIPNADRVSPAPDAAFALSMLVASARGDVYTFKEYSHMVRAAGFRQARRLKKGDFGRWMIIASR